MRDANQMVDLAVRRPDFRVNNFDLIRLLAASQVLLLHATRHLDVHIPSTISWLISLFPGVPIFFFTSGYLISNSFEANSSLRDYVLNRMLRIYPALIVCLFITVVAIAATGYFDKVSPEREFFLWVAGQATFLQFFNPEFLRGFGVGVVNGSLWTISVELQFYVLVPCLYALLCWLGGRPKCSDMVIGGLLAIFVLANRLYFSTDISLSEHLVYRLTGVSFIPWLYMFLLGALVQRHFETLHRLLSGKGLYVLVVYILLMVSTRSFNLTHGNALDPLSYAALVAVVFSCAYSFSSLSRRLLRGNDISYGIYIYHMPVVNVLIELGLRGRLVDIVLAAMLTGILAGASWFIVERPALRLKRHPMNPLSKRGPASDKMPINSRT